jgi:hypothetical protein
MEKMFMRPLKVTNLNRLTAELQNKIQESRVPQQQAFQFFDANLLDSGTTNLEKSKNVDKNGHFVGNSDSGYFLQIRCKRCKSQVFITV